VTDLYFSEQANALLEELEGTPSRQHLLGRINTALDMLETDPHDVRCRRRRFNTIGCWTITVISDEGDWLILWSERNELDTEVNIHAITPDP
jgi:hypothetical protein